MNQAYDNLPQPHDLDDIRARHLDEESLLWRRLLEVAESEAAKVEGRWQALEEGR